MQLLVSEGTEVEAREAETGITALMLAANRGYLEVLRSLIEAGADVPAKAADGWTALKAAEMVGDEDAAALLRAADARE